MLQGAQRIAGSLREREAAGEIVVRGGIARLEPDEDGGEVRLLGEVVNKKRPYERRIAMVFRSWPSCAKAIRQYRSWCCRHDMTATP